MIIMALINQTAAPVVIDGFKSFEACNDAKGQIVYNLKQMPNVFIIDARAECMSVKKQLDDKKNSVPDNPGGPYAN